MFNKILVALDLLDSSEAVFDSALELAVTTGSQLMLLHALVGDRDGGPSLPIAPGWDYYAATNDHVWTLYQTEWKEYEQRGLETLRRYAQQATQAGVAAEFTQTANNPGRLICDLAHTWDADVIVVGSHGRKGLSELLIGSVSNYVMHHSPTSVFVVHLGKAQPAKTQPAKTQPAKTQSVTEQPATERLMTEQRQSPAAQPTALASLDA